MQMAGNLSRLCAQKRPLSTISPPEEAARPTTEPSELPSISLINLFVHLYFFNLITTEMYYK